MPCQKKLLDHLERALWNLDPASPERSLIDTVLLACDLSEDAMEIDDLVSGVIQRRTTRILPRQRDPMLAQSLSESAFEPTFESVRGHAYESESGAAQAAPGWTGG